MTELAKIKPGHLRRTGRTEGIIDVVANPVADAVDAMIAGRQIAERAAGKPHQLIGLAVTAWIEVR